MLNYDQFVESMRSALEDYLGEEYIVTVEKVTKNNDVELTGVSIRRKDLNISPTIYMEEVYGEYKNGAKLGDLVTRVIEMYEESSKDESLDLSMLMEYENIKDRLVYKLINIDSNKRYLDGVPHMDFLDMAVVFYFCLMSDETGLGTILVRNELCELWGVTVEDLMKLARENTPRIMRENICVISDIIFNSGCMFLEDAEDISSLGRGMYVMTNQQKLFGAATIMYPDILKNFSADMDSNLYVLPSSVHEVIIVPEKPGMSAAHLKSIVVDVNRTQVDPLEVLSDSVYYYDRQMGELILAA